jgi:type I restriction enzyme R subunit
LRIDERNHVEKPLLDQLAGLKWEIIDLDTKQHPADSYRQNFTEVVMLSVLREQLKVINPWLEDDQVEEVIKQLTASFPGSGLILNNQGTHPGHRTPHYAGYCAVSKRFADCGD